MAGVFIAEYDPAWAAAYYAIEARVRAALGRTVVAIEHVGSTSVPGLAAKPVIDVNLAVAVSAREEDYAPQLEAAGFELAVREPEWFEHRMFKGRTRGKPARLLPRLS